MEGGGGGGGESVSKEDLMRRVLFLEGRGEGFGRWVWFEEVKDEKEDREMKEEAMGAAAQALFLFSVFLPLRDYSGHRSASGARKRQAF